MRVTCSSSTVSSTRSVQSVAACLLYFLVLPFAYVASATEPFPSTFICQQANGDWAWRGGSFTRSLVLVDRKEDRHVLSLSELFPGKEYDLHVSQTTAGPMWGEGCLSYVVKIRGTSYLTVVGVRGKRLLVNLDKAKVEKPDPFADALRDEDHARIRSILSETTKLLLKKEGYPDTLNGAMLLAAKYKMADVRPQLEVVERTTWQTSMCTGELGKTSFGEGLNPEMRSNGSNIYANIYYERGIAQSALRRMGLAPKGYPVVVFENHKAYTALDPDERYRRAKQLKAGFTSQQVYDLLGGPDELVDAGKLAGPLPEAPKDSKATDQPPPGYDAWRYDWGPQPDLSLLILWNSDGRIGKVVAVRPGLWHGNELFDEEQRKQRETLGRISCKIDNIGTKGFSAKVEDFFATRPKESGKK